MLPHNSEIFQAYFDAPVPDDLPDREQLFELIEHLRNSRIRFCICDPDDDRIYYVSLFESEEDAAQNCGDHLHIAPVLLPR